MAHPIEKEQEEIGFFDRGIGYGLKKTGQGAMWGLGKYGEGLDWTNEQVKLRNTPLGTLANVTGLDKNKYVSGALDYSYGDLRGDVAEGAGTLTEQALKFAGRSDATAEAWGKGVEVAGQILIPDAVDYLGGVGYLDNLARASKKLPDLAGGIDKLSSGLSKTIPDSRVLATSAGRIPMNQIDQFTPANTLAIKSKGGGGVKKAERAFNPKNLDDSKKFAGDFFNKIYKQDYKYGGADSITSTHRAIRSPKAAKAGINKNIGLQGSPHHFSIDDELALIVSNTSDAPELVAKLNKLDIFPGNHPNNFIMAYHDNTKLQWNATKKAINDMWAGKPNAPSDKEINTFLKAIPEGKMFDPKNPNFASAVDSSKKLEGRNWSKILPPGKKLTDIKLPEFILGVDHQDLIHGAIDNLPARKKLIELAKSDKWLELSTDARAALIANVAKQQQNVALNVNKWRLEKIKNYLTEMDLPKEDWVDIQVWMMQNARQAASLDWHKTAQVGTGSSIEDLIKPLDNKSAQEVANVFNLEQVPQTTDKLKRLLENMNLVERTLTEAMMF